MRTRDFTVEAPRQSGRETEFFLQTTPPNTVSCAAHIHNVVELLHVKEGSYSVTLDDEHYEIRQGDLILFCSDAIHHVVAGNEPNNSYYVIKIPPSFFIEFSRHEVGAEYVMRFALHRKENKSLWTAEELEQGELKPILDALIKEYNEPLYASEVAMKLKIMELLLAILREGEQSASRPSDRTAEMIYRVMRFVQLHFAEDIDEKELAKEIGMSYSYFSRSFKRTTGMTFKSYLNRTRISKAEQILLQNGGTISEIATACGYNSISYFISVYRTITGKTPYQALKATKQPHSET
ncbi:MAG: helix-turn-helix transcriptional regulator [Clostridia bacterium]|nr:helix-turn-helix transcriptional regulator [Clostridia bacterium]